MTPDKSGEFSLHFESGNEAFGNGEFDQALRAYSRSYQINARHTVLNGNIAATLYELGQFDRAKNFAKRAIELNPEFNRPHVTLGMLHLLNEDFSLGWPEYEWTATLADKFKTLPEERKWRGESLRNCRIVVIDEQGYGDTIQFLRFSRFLVEAGAEVFLDIKKPLRRLGEANPQLGSVLQSDQALEFTYWTRLLSIPAVINAEAKQIPTTPGYLVAPPLRADSRINHVSGRKIGVIWKGSDVNGRDKIRSVRLSDLKPLIQLSEAHADLHFFHLHHQSFGEEINQAGLAGAITELHNEISDFADLAAVIHSLDLVITIDTAVAHLAGALGKKTYCILSHVPDWRWGINRSDSLWYPNTRLFRQPIPDDWQSPIDQIIQEVAHF
ncbi:MAG: tetratricopeptide repeat protein [Verrucomicrobiales bacterium]|nr:tetratricopeptide repeat protein [Verrucomicrobiales bacterium]